MNTPTPRTLPRALSEFCDEPSRVLAFCVALFLLFALANVTG